MSGIRLVLRKHVSKSYYGSQEVSQSGVGYDANCSFSEITWVQPLQPCPLQSMTFGCDLSVTLIDNCLIVLKSIGWDNTSPLPGTSDLWKISWNNSLYIYRSILFLFRLLLWLNINICINHTYIYFTNWAKSNTISQDSTVITFRCFHALHLVISIGQMFITGP